MPSIPPFRELIKQAEREAIHLELRDAYTPDDPVFAEWRAGRLDVTRPVYPDWAETVREHVGRGVRFRRARVVSEPLSDFVRFEHAITDALNVAPGEEVRWLTRRRAVALALPANDFWLFDDHLLRIHHFDGDGRIVEDELSTDPHLIRGCRDAFEAVWALAVGHADYRPV